MGPKKPKSQDMSKVEQTMQLRPTAVSVAIDWGQDEGGGGFTSVKKSQPKPKPQQQQSCWAAAAPAAPIYKPKPQAPIKPGVPVGAELAAPRPKAKKAAKPKQSPAAAAYEDPMVEESFKTVKKDVKPKGPRQGSTCGRKLDPNDGKPYNYHQFIECYGEEEGKQVWEFANPEPSDKQRIAAARDERQRAVAMSKVVGGEVVTKSKKEVQEEKKRLEKIAKEAKKEAEAARKRREEEERRAREEKAGGVVFVSVQQGAKAKQASKGKSMAEAFSQPTVWAPTKGGNQKSSHIALPKHKQERDVARVDVGALAAFKQKMQSMQKQNRPDTADLEFKVKIQGKWYPVRELAQKDFERAPAIVQVYTKATEGRCVGGFFISQGGKDWANERTVDEFWMAVSYLKSLARVLGGDGGEDKLAPYWGRGEDMTVAVELLKASLAADKFPTLSLRHIVKHGTQLQVVHCDVYDFVRKLLDESKLVQQFIERLERAVDTLAATPRFKDPERASMLSDVRDKLPKGFPNAVEALEEAFAAFSVTYPEPGDEEDEASEEAAGAAAEAAED
eukprot:Hpha_TRINITY_DN16922_c0_g7::TRINITY_DN16922_c0_g7_i1::g.56118::m.56118